MSDHSHSDCEHKELSYCRQHDVTWCRACEREWGNKPPYYWWWSQSPTTTVSTDTGWVAPDTVTVSHAGHTN